MKYVKSQMLNDQFAFSANPLALKRILNTTQTDYEFQAKETSLG